MKERFKLNDIGARHFAMFRIVFGTYLCAHFVQLVPFAASAFSREGQLGDAALNFTYGLFPNLLYVFDTPFAATAFVALLALCALLFALGFQRRLLALLLWYGWAALFNRNNLIANPGLPFVGYLLLLSALVPRGEGWSLDDWIAGRRSPVADGSSPGAPTEWSFPRVLVYGSWALLAAGYSISGVHKLLAPSWRNGEALRLVLELPLARDNALREFLLALPDPALPVMTWSVLVLEAGFLLFCLTGAGRKYAFLAICSMHLGIMLTVDFVDLTLGMLMVHMLLFDPAWLPRALRDAVDGRPAVSPPKPAEAIGPRRAVGGVYSSVDSV